MEWSARFSEDVIKLHIKYNFVHIALIAGKALKNMTDIEDVGLTVAWMVECESLTE